MDELGQILREAREAKGYTLAEVHEKIRINPRYLEALEDGRYDDLPTPTHIRGFLRNYSRFLGLDPDPLLARYELHNSGKRPKIIQPPSSRDDTPLPDKSLMLPLDEQPFFDPINMEVDGRGPSSTRDPVSIVNTVIILSLIFFIGLVASKFVPMLMGNGDGNVIVAEEINEAVQNLINNQPEATATTYSVPTDFPFQTIVTNTNPNQLTVPTEPTPTRPPLPVNLSSINLQLEITERTWMRVTIDGDVVFTGIARDGESHQWQAEEQAQLESGNAVAVFVTINDIQLGRLGQRGEALDETWTTTQ